MSYREKVSLIATVARASAVLFVTMILFLNLAALGLSFGPVYERSHKVYTSGIDGSLPIPDLSLGLDDLEIEVPSWVMEGDPFNVRVETLDGEAPAMPLFLRFQSSNVSLMDTPLHDDFDNEGNWFSWTIVQGMIPAGSHDVRLGYRGHVENLTFAGNAGHILVNEAEGPFVAMGSFDNVVSSGSVPVILDGPGSDDIDEITIAPAGKEDIHVQRNVDGRFELDVDGHDLTGWKRISLSISTGRPVPRKDVILRFPGDGAGLDRNLELRIDQPFSEYDDLYDQDPIVNEEVGMDDPILLSRTYYRFELSMTEEERGAFDQDGYPPIPRSYPVMYLEGKRIDLRPDNGSDSFFGFSRTPSSYSDDEGGLMVDHWPFEREEAFINISVILKERQSPALRIYPDPYHIKDSIPTEYEVSVIEGYELVSYRLFKESATIVVDGMSYDADRKVIDTDDRSAISYEAVIPSVSGGSVLEVRAETEFEMDVWISFIFFFIPKPITGMGVPVWFTLISIAIALSVIYLFWRSIIMREGGGKGKIGIRDPFQRNTDISILSKTFVGALFFSWAVVFLFDLMEQPTPSPDILSYETPIWIRMILLADASVWEEVVARVCFIGLPLMVIRFKVIVKSGMGWLADRLINIFKWENIKFLLGGQGKFGTAEVVLILLSSSFFGLAHIGWGPWKVLPTFVTGALFGYLFIKVGLHAAIAMHFLFDYLSFIYELTDLSYFPLIGLMFFSLIIGAFFLAEVMTGFKRWIENRASRRLDPKWMLVIHSSLTILLMAYLYFKGVEPDLVLFFAIVPILEAGGYLLFRNSDREVFKIGGTIMVYFAAVFTLALAPVALMWVTDNDDHREKARIRADTPQRNLLRAPPQYARKRQRS